MIQCMIYYISYITFLIHLQKHFYELFFRRTHNESLVHRLTTTTKYDIKIRYILIFFIKSKKTTDTNNDT